MINTPNIFTQLNITHSINHHQNISKTNNDIRFFCINIRSLRQKLHDLEILINSFSQITHIIIITETWLYDNEIDYFNIPNYNAVHSTRQKKRGGGCAIYIHRSLQYSLIYNNEWDYNNAVGVHITGCNIDVNVFAIYKPPNSNGTEFINVLSDLVDRFKNNVLFGDMNLNLLEANSNTDVQEYLDVISSKGHLVLNCNDRAHATRIDNNTANGSILDHMISDLILHSFTLSLHDTHLSDHRYLYASIHNVTPAIIRSPHKTIIDYDEINNSSAIIPKINSAMSFEQLIEHIQTITTAHTKILSTKHQLKQKSPWISNLIIRLTKAKDFYYKLKKKYPLNLYYQKQYVYYRNQAQYKSRTDKKNYFSNKFQSNISNPKLFWATTNEVLFNKTKNEMYIPTIEENNLILTDPKEVAIAFNKYFTEVIQPITVNCYPQTQQNPIAKQNFLIRKCSAAEISNIIHQLCSSTSNGYDNISIKFIKHYQSIFSDKLAVLINDCISKGQFPDALKIAKVVPILKAGSKKLMTNYRPISVLSALSKIFERVVQYRLDKYLQENNIISENQFGFVPNSNTLAAVTQLFNFIDTNVDRKRFVGAVFIDLRKAFDSVQHTDLFIKLNDIGIVGRQLKLFVSYHTQRKQFVQLGTTKSNLLITHTGVAQGSILSTTEFAIFINEIFSLKLHSKIQGYADDIVLMHTAPNVQLLINNLQQDLNLIKSWLDKNHLTLNSTKTKYMVFQRSRSIDFTEIPNICIDNIVIERVGGIKYLGLHIDENLSWNTHINKIKNNIRPITFAIRRLRYCLTKEALWNIYHAYVVTHLNYLSPIWSNTTQGRIGELKVLQNRILRIIYGYSTLSASNLLYNAAIFPVEKLILFQTCMLIFKIKNNQIKHNFEITYRSDTHNHYTRRLSHINLPFNNTNLGQNSAINRGFIEYNKLPSHIKEETSISKFKKLIKELIFSY